MLRAGIYCNEGELAAMSTVLNEYSYFIEGTVAKNAGNTHFFERLSYKINIQFY